MKDPKRDARRACIHMSTLVTIHTGSIQAMHILVFAHTCFVTARGHPSLLFAELTSLAYTVRFSQLDTRACAWLKQNTVHESLLPGIYVVQLIQSNASIQCVCIPRRMNMIARHAAQIKIYAQLMQPENEHLILAAGAHVCMYVYKCILECFYGGAELKRCW